MTLAGDEMRRDQRSTGGMKHQRDAIAHTFGTPERLVPHARSFVHGAEHQIPFAQNPDAQSTSAVHGSPNRAAPASIQCRTAAPHSRRELPHALRLQRRDGRRNHDIDRRADRVLQRLDSCDVVLFIVRGRIVTKRTPTSSILPASRSTCSRWGRQGAELLKPRSDSCVS